MAGNAREPDVVLPSGEIDTNPSVGYRLGNEHVVPRVPATAAQRNCGQAGARRLPFNLKTYDADGNEQTRYIDLDKIAPLDLCFDRRVDSALVGDILCGLLPATAAQPVAQPVAPQLAALQPAAPQPAVDASIAARVKTAFGDMGFRCLDVMLQRDAHNVAVACLITQRRDAGTLFSPPLEPGVQFTFWDERNGMELIVETTGVRFSRDVVVDLLFVVA